jgi:hypothetical protein
MSRRLPAKRNPAWRTPVALEASIDDFRYLVAALVVLLGLFGVTGLAPAGQKVAQPIQAHRDIACRLARLRIICSAVRSVICSLDRRPAFIDDRLSPEARSALAKLLGE